MTTMHRIFSLFLVLTVPVFFIACEGDDREDEFGAETEGYEQVPTEPAPMEGTGTFSSFDQDADGALTEDEFRRSLTQGSGWTQWDTDGNNSVSQQEFDAAFSTRDWYDAGLFSQWDTDGDGELSQDDWAAGLFDEWDENGDNKIQESEYRQDLFQRSM